MTKMFRSVHPKIVAQPIEHRVSIMLSWNMYIVTSVGQALRNQRPHHMKDVALKSATQNQSNEGISVIPYHSLHPENKLLSCSLASTYCSLQVLYKSAVHRTLSTLT